MAKNLILATLLALALLTPSCLPTRQKLHYYVLVPQPGNTDSAIVIEDVKLAGYLDRHELCYLAETGELVRMSKAKWAQPLGAIVKNYLVTATRPKSDFNLAPGAKVTIHLDQFLMTQDGTFQVAGAVETRVNGASGWSRKAFDFQLPSRGEPNVQNLVAQSRTALDRIVEIAFGKQPQ